MIHYLVTAGHAYTVDGFLYTWRPELASQVNVLPYERLVEMDRAPAGTYIFTDLERLNPGELDAAAEVWDQLIADGNHALNDPRRVMDRYTLLRTVHARGEGHFQIYRLSDTRRPDRFPVFLRPDHAHEICSGLLHNPEELDAAIEEAAEAGHAPEDLLMVEFLDTMDDDGYFRKYCSYLVGDHLIPAWINLAKGWSVRYTRHPPEIETQKWAETWEYVRTNPHEEWMRRMFRLANFEYGRIDYSLLHGEPQLWEINTNPSLLYPRHLTTEVGLPFSEYFADALETALRALDPQPLGVAHRWKRRVGRLRGRIRS